MGIGFGTTEFGAHNLRSAHPAICNADIERASVM